MKTQANDYRLKDIPKDLGHFPQIVTENSVIIDENIEILDQSDLKQILRACIGYGLTAKLAATGRRERIVIEITH